MEHDGSRLKHQYLMLCKTFNDAQELLQTSEYPGITVMKWINLVLQIYNKPTITIPINQNTQPTSWPRPSHLDIEGSPPHIHKMDELTEKGTMCCSICGISEEQIRNLASKGKYSSPCLRSHKIYNRFVIFKQAVIDYIIMDTCKRYNGIIDVKTIHKHLLSGSIDNIKDYINLRSIGVTYGFEKETGVIDCIYIGKQRKFGAISLRMVGTNIDLHLGMNGWKGQIHHYHIPSWRNSDKEYITVEPKDVRWHDRTFMGRIHNFCTAEERIHKNQIYWFDSVARRFVLEVEVPGVPFAELMKGKDMIWGDRMLINKVLRNEETSPERYLFLPCLDDYELGLYILQSMNPKMDYIMNIDPYHMSRTIHCLVEVMAILSRASISHTKPTDPISSIKEIENINKLGSIVHLVDFYKKWAKDVLNYWLPTDPNKLPVVLNTLPQHPLDPCIVNEEPLPNFDRRYCRLKSFPRQRYERLSEGPLTGKSDEVMELLKVRSDLSVSTESYIQRFHQAARKAKQLVLEKWPSPMTGIQLDHIKFSTEGMKGDSEVYVRHLGTQECPGWSRLINRGDFIGHVGEGVNKKPFAMYGPIKIVGNNLRPHEFSNVDNFFLKMDGSQGKIKIQRYQGGYVKVLSSKDSPTASFYDDMGYPIPKLDHIKTMITYCEEDTDFNLRKSGYIVRQLHNLIKGKHAFDILEGITLHCEVLGINEKLQIIPNTKTDPYESVFVYGGADERGRPLSFDYVKEQVCKPLGLKFVRSITNGSYIGGIQVNITTLRYVGLFTLGEGVVSRRTPQPGETVDNAIRTGSSKEKFAFFQLSQYLRRSSCDHSKGRFKPYNLMCGIIGLFDPYVSPSIVNKMVFLGILFMRSYIGYVKHETIMEINSLHPHRFARFMWNIFPQVFNEPIYREFYSDKTAPVDMGFTDQQFLTATHIVNQYPPQPGYNYSQHISYYLHIPTELVGIRTPVYKWISPYMVNKYKEDILCCLRTGFNAGLYIRHGSPSKNKNSYNVTVLANGVCKIKNLSYYGTEEDIKYIVKDDPRIYINEAGHIKAYCGWKHVSPVRPESFLEHTKHIVTNNKYLYVTNFSRYLEIRNRGYIDSGDLTHITVIDYDEGIYKNACKGTVYIVIEYTGEVLKNNIYTLIHGTIPATNIIAVYTNNFHTINSRTRNYLTLEEVKTLIVQPQSIDLKKKREDTDMPRPKKQRPGKDFDKNVWSNMQYDPSKHLSNASI